MEILNVSISFRSSNDNLDDEKTLFVYISKQKKKHNLYNFYFIPQTLWLQLF